MRTARAVVELPGPIAEAEALWYDVSRWPAFVDGFSSLARRDPEWPRSGELLWDSRPGGRGRVRERVTVYEPRLRQVADVEDEQLSGEQRVSFAPTEAGVRMEIELSYGLKAGGPFMFLTDVLFIRRAVRDSLRRTLTRFARELAGDRAIASGAAF